MDNKSRIEPTIWVTGRGHYQVRYRDTSGRQRARSFDRLPNARNFKAQGAAVDAAISQLLIDTVTPLALEVALTVKAEVSEDQQLVTRSASCRARTEAANDSRSYSAGRGSGLTHDPEKAAASYLSGEMRGRRRAGFERHIVECEDCWSEVQLGRAGRSLAESGRELAPQELREQVRAVIAATPVPRLAWRPRWVTAILAMMALGLASIGYVSLQSPNQPAVIDAVLADYREGSPVAQSIEPKLPARLGDLRA